MNVVLTTVETSDLYLQRYAGVLLSGIVRFSDPTGTVVQPYTAMPCL